MKTNLKPLILALGFALLLLAPEESRGFYNPSTGKWIARDPAEEEGGLNLLSFLCNDSINATDPFGLVRYLLISVASDPTVPRPTSKKDTAPIHEMKKNNDAMKAGLEKVLWKCKQCDDKPLVLYNYEQYMKLSSPSKAKQWNVSVDRDLIFDNFQRILKSKKPGTVPVFWTSKAIVNGDEGTGNGFGFNTRGIILQYNHWFPIDTVLAHELGHYAGYSGGDIGIGHAHSSDPNNVMSNGQPADTPDEDWCKKVASLIQETK